MATKSMLKDVEIKDKKFGIEFANALETAFEMESETNLRATDTAKRECIELTGDKIKEFLGVL